MIVGDSPTFWIGLDDTDEREFGCTTHDFNDLLNHLNTCGFSIEDPRLVRLWPFAPRRTRGNAALAASISTRDEFSLSSCLDDWFTSRFGDIVPGNDIHSAQPVLILSSIKFPESIYWNTVREYVELECRVSELASIPYRIWSTPSGMGGLIGASAAIAWQGTDDFTWECTAWRNGRGPRHVPVNIVNDMTNKFPSTFLNRDPTAERSLIAPRTPCPVLYGIRGESAQGVLDAHTFLQQNGAEISADHRVHRSNQATDDHLGGPEIGVVNNIRVMQGGHVEIDTGRKLLAFSQGGDMNKLSQRLMAGDNIEWLGLEHSDGSIHLERIRLVHGERNRVRPICNCGRRYKSQGQNQPLKCPYCKFKHADVWCVDNIDSDWKEPPPSHRRHLAKPLSRRGKSED
jgi:tRNA(Ile2)-agmatinylcytidine synthase